MAFDDFLAHRQADAGALVALARVQALKDDEDALEEFFLDPDAIVAHGKSPATILPPGSDVNLRRLGAMEFQGVGEQILQNLRQLRGIRQNRRQHRIVRDRGSGLLNGQLEILARRPECLRAFRARERLPAGAHAGEVEQIFDEPPHPLRAIDSDANELPRIVIQTLAVTPVEELQIV